jgi:hypothetical protein
LHIYIHTHSLSLPPSLSVFLAFVSLNATKISLSGIKRLKRVHSKRVLNPNERLLKIQILCKTRRETIECRVSWSPFSNLLVLLSQRGPPLFLSFFSSFPSLSLHSLPCSSPISFFCRLWRVDIDISTALRPALQRHFAPFFFPL